MRRQPNISPAPARLWIKWGLLIIIALMPLHAFLSVWLGSLTGHQSLIQAWKEVLIVSLLAAGGIVLSKSPEQRQRLIQPVNLAIMAFIVLSLIVSLANGTVGSRSFWFGAKIDLEFLLLFIVAQLADNRQLTRLCMVTLLVATSLVTFFGILQVLFLPSDFLSRFGYGATTILPYRLIDPALPTGIRILSTLSGPNQLGSFLILPICLCAFLLIRHRWWALLPLSASLFVLFHSFSRSAWIGTAIGLAAVVLLSVRLRTAILLAIISILGLILVVVTINGALKQTKFQYYLLHGRIFEQRVEGSDQSRLASLSRGIEEVKHHPFGQGLGSAGPASYQGSNTIITENFYAQLAIETGILGLLLFCACPILLSVRLFKLRPTSPMAVPVLSALIGLTATNLFLHSWADSSTALIFWGIAGTIIGQSSHE